MTEQKQYATGIAFTSFMHNGYEVSVTVRDGDKIEGIGSMRAIMDIIDEEIAPTVEGQRSTGQEQNLTDNLPPQEHPDSGQEFGDNPKHWGLVKWPPRAAELSPNDEYEVIVDAYERLPDKIIFHSSESQYSILTHYLNKEYPIKVFTEAFKGWDPDVTEGETPIPNGAVVLKIKCSGSDNLKKSGNPYQNLNGMRRPDKGEQPF